MEIIGSESAMKGEVETKGMEGVVRCEGEEFCGEIERKSNKVKEGPDDEFKEKGSPDDERERVGDVFGISKGSDKG